MKLKQLAQGVFVIESFLSAVECNELIDQAEKVGFETADVQTSDTKRQLLTNIRNNERVNYESDNVAIKWWSRLSSLPFPKFEDYTATGLSPYFRFYKYVPGQKFNMHKDGRQTVAGKTTYYTFLVYLNEACKGGDTKFRVDNLSIAPKTGKALLFQHDLWHQGVEVEDGVKYVLRTDVLYS
jgi:hypothetical protein